MRSSSQYLARCIVLHGERDRGLAYTHVGDPLPAHLADFEYVLGEPNKRQWLATILADPDRVADYMATNCTEKVISSPRAWQYQHFIPPEEAATLNGDPTMLQCVDNFGAWEQFDRYFQVTRCMHAETKMTPPPIVCRNLVDVYITCSPPFGLEPDCFTDLGHYMITSPQCASAYARMWNVADPAPLLNVASHVNAIHDACARVTTEVRLPAPHMLPSQHSRCTRTPPLCTYAIHAPHLCKYHCRPGYAKFQEPRHRPAVLASTSLHAHALNGKLVCLGSPSPKRCPHSHQGCVALCVYVPRVCQLA